MSKTTRILIVEDNPNDYDLAQRELRKSLESSVFKRVETYDEYLAELRSFQPDLILSDYSLTDFDGMKALQLAQEYLPLTPLIIWTGSMSEEVATRCLKAGAHNYILKENLTRLAPAVLHALEERQLLIQRKEAEDKLSRSEMNYRTLAENSLQGIAIFQRQGIVYVNPAMCKIMGYTADELLTMSQEQILALTHPDDRTIAQERAGRRQAGESISDVNDVRIIQKDGTICWIQTFANSIEYDGQPAILATSIEVTDRKQAEEKLRTQERHFRALIENSLDSISLLSADGVLIWENPAVERALGYQPGEFVHRNIFELMHPDDLAWTSAAFSQLVREPGSQQHGIFRLKHSDGTWRWIEARATNMLDEPGVGAMVLNYRDITERKNAEQELRENQAQYRNLVETSHDLIWAVDAEGRFTFVNAAARHIYGFEPEELIGRYYFDIMDPEHDHLNPETFQEAVSSQNEYHEHEVYVRHRDGRQIILSANSIILRDQGGTVIGVTGTSRDITDQKRAEQALRKERNLLRTLVDHLPDRIYAMDRQGKKTLSNTADWQASGKKQMEDVIGKTDFDLYPPELAEPYWQVDHEVLESGRPVINYEEPGLDSEGNRVSVLTSKIPLRDETGNVIGLVGIGRDITKRKQTEEALRENERRYRTLFEDMPIAIWEEDFSAVKAHLDALKSKGITDMRAYLTSRPEQLELCENLFRILDVNHAAVEMYRAGTKNRLIREALQGSSRGEQEHRIEDLLAIAEGRTSNSWEGADETSDGTSLEIRLNWSVVPGYEKDFSKVIVTTIDVTENTRVQQAEREQRTLAEALRDTAQLLNSTLDYGEVLDHILSAVKRVAPHNAGTIMLIEEGFARVVRAHGYEKLGNREDILGVRLPLADTTNLRQMLETRQPVIVSDTHTYSGWKRMETTEWLRSSVGAPISIREEVIGFILLDSETPEFFSPLHAERLKSFANQAALAIHNARLLQQARAEIAERLRTENELHYKNEDLRLLNVVNNAVVRGQDLDSIIDLLAGELKRIFSAVGSTIYMLSADKRSLTMHQYSFSPEIERKIEKLIGFRIPKIEIPIKEGGHFHNVLFTKQSAITTDPQKIQEWISEFVDTKFLPAIARTAVRKLVPHIYKLLNIGSTIVVPLISQEEVIGFLDVSSAGLLKPNDLKRIEIIGEQLTSLIQRQQANEKVRKSEEFLQGIQNSLSAHIAILDEYNSIVQVNEAWREFADQNGVRNTDYGVGVNYFDVCETAGVPDARVAKEIESAIGKVLSKKTSEASVEFPSHSPTKKRWFNVHITCFDDGKQKWVILAHENITERKLAESALLQSQARYRDLFDKSPISLWEEDYSLVKRRIDELRESSITDFSEYFDTYPEQIFELASLVRIIDVNRASLDLYRTTKKDDLLKNLSAIVNKDVLSHFREELQGLLSPIKGFVWEGSDNALDGQALDLIVTGTIPSGYEENWSRVIVSVVDITEHKRAENELRASEERFRQLATNIEEVFWMTEADTGREIYASPAVEKIWGMSMDALLREPDVFLNSILPADRSIVLSGIEREKKGEKVELEYRIAHPDGSIRWIWDRAFPIFDETGQVKVLAGISADITQRKQNELEIQRHLMELEALYENGLTVGRLLEPKEIGNQIIQTFARHLSWHHVAIRLLNPETDKLELIAFNQPGLSDESHAEAEMRFTTMVSSVGQGLSGWAMQTGKSIRTGNVHTHPQYVDTHEGIMSGLYMPLRVGDRIVGCISVESNATDAFTQQDERLLATLANQAAIAFENARLYQAAQQELSERTRAQQALWASETHYRQLADSITDILFELDQDLRYTHWNKASEMFSGLPAEDVIGKSLQEIEGTGAEIFKRPEIYKSVLRDRQAKIFEINASTKGQKRELEISAYPSARGVSVVARDVTERKGFEALLQKRFELIEYSTHHSIKNVLQKVIDEVSALTESHIGFLHLVEADEQAINMQIWSTETLENFHDAQIEEMHYPLNQAGLWADAVRQRRSVIHNNFEALPAKNGLPEGHVRVIREMVIPILRNDKIVAVIGVGNKEHEYTQQDIIAAERFADYAWDITERRRIESELAEERNQLARRVEERTADLSRANANLARALRVKDEFLANMSHELRTPLNAILGLSESLGEQVAGPLNDKQAKYLSTINESGHHLLSLINDILDLAKIEAGQITLDINKVDINSVCQVSLRMIKQLAQKKNQEVSFVLNANLGLMWADERRLKQMIVNLLSNAVKFTPEWGKLGLEVHGDEEANIVSITVWDEGIGISENDIQRLFRPFVQLDAGLAREATGTGLGLALVAQMAQLHGGSVIVDSRPGNGSSFTIRLPWQPAMAGETMARLKSTGKFRAIKPDEIRPTILLVEDTQEVVMMLVDYLEMAGFNMVTAQDGIDGLTQAKIAHPDLILMDIQMPRMDGFEATQKLRSDPEFKETPIIALTALAMPNDRQRCLDAGMNEYLSKPVNLKALSKTIKAFLFESEGNQS